MFIFDIQNHKTNVVGISSLKLNTRILVQLNKVTVLTPLRCYHKETNPQNTEVNKLNTRVHLD